MSLYKQLLIGICLFTLTIFCGNFFATLESSREQYHNQLSAHAQDAATALGLSLTANIDDPVMTELMVNSIFDSGYFYRIRVIDIKSGKPIIERQNVPPSANVPGWFARMVQINPGQGEAMVMRGWTQAARVEVISHPMFALTRLWESLVASFLWLTGCSALCILGAMLLLRHRLRPLNYIVEQAMAISRREFLSLPALPKTPELRRVVEATNMMVTQLKALFSEQAKRTESLRQEAYNDSLTGLNNRRAFDMKLLTKLSDEDHADGNLILLRVQDLMGLNQRLGGANTDKLLKSVTDILNNLQQRFFHSEGFVARIRGGEFAIITAPVLATEMESFASALNTQLKALYETGLSDVNPVAHFAEISFRFGDSPQTILRQADQILVAAEADMRTFVDPENVEKLAPDEDHHHWHQRLSAILDKEAFELYSQPVYQCNDQHIVLHRKILARIKTEDGEIIPAGRFIPWVRRLALGRRMDVVMLKQTLRAMESTTHAFALSISGESVADDESLNALLQPLKSARHLTSRLTLELDENELPDPERVSVLVKKLQDLGCGLGIQHFGGRFHLIGNLPQWGLAWIKVDGGYIHRIDEEDDKKLFIEAIYWATRQINLPLIAERVETEGELAVLEKIGLYGAMGRYFSDASTLDPK
ncbi:cyclic di-GMP receptor LapD [Kluyvera intermedia]|jgi:diguanylate cyclase (GGDEF)-like protein|uniref:LapD/MoxY N-terminal periplasmic domain-containing protein n=1 Tax=Kluyvera intermedia TaxID=61648 RepID=A0AA95G1Y1_KLUIN|nr:LapD/MoxY N-terminal periplasmic domain-containing protein [Kluyvera intermedia]WEJ83138.1 MAG: LapD/MoxY N-terminal periplasmic domain-containing protein [Kluyvera intermedia]WGL55903.1 LapD/MoxY N-terminal periplasmic domain-containing protein [Kluyvera intermedia]